MDVTRYLVQELSRMATDSWIHLSYQCIPPISCVEVMVWVSQDFWLVGGITQASASLKQHEGHHLKQLSKHSSRPAAVLLTSRWVLQLCKVARNKPSDFPWFYCNILRLRWKHAPFLSSCCFQRAACAATSSSGAKVVTDGHKSEALCDSPTTVVWARCSVFTLWFPSWFGRCRFVVLFCVFGFATAIKVFFFF